ncbi:hypothetical protein [Caballeronia pedi]|nr:hypothetical protein [Caballeronia pedi]
MKPENHSDAIEPTPAKPADADLVTCLSCGATAPTAEEIPCGH